MRVGRGRVWCGIIMLLAGCAGPRQQQLHQAMLADQNPAAHARDLEYHYQVRYPDVLRIDIHGRPDLSGLRPVGLDGTIDVGRLMSVDGRTVLQLQRDIALALRLPYSAVRVRVEQYASQQIYLFGEVGNRHRVVAYRGPETILDLIQRIGGPGEGAELNDIHVVRGHVAEGKPPEVFHVDLQAIVTKQDLSTNIRLEPFDRVHIGQTRRQKMSSYMPPWFKLFTPPPRPNRSGELLAPAETITGSNP